MHNHQKLLLDNKLCDELGQEARKYILANNSIEKTIEKEYNIYKTIIN
tara:strand:- start:456 stop:599 length:144 start_codon:yes stop_codon:yes gene_type:complete